MLFHLDLDRTFPILFRVSEPLVKLRIVRSVVPDGPRMYRAVDLHVENDALAKFRLAGSHVSRQDDRALARLPECFRCQPRVMRSTTLAFLRLSN